jgi:hypothetical protein
MSKHDLANAVITTADGVLVGLLPRGDAQRVPEHVRETIRSGDGDDDD